MVPSSDCTDTELISWVFNQNSVCGPQLCTDSHSEPNWYQWRPRKRSIKKVIRMVLSYCQSRLFVSRPIVLPVFCYLLSNPIPYCSSDWNWLIVGNGDDQTARLEPHLEDSTNNFNPWSSVGYLSLQFPTLNQVCFRFLMKSRLPLIIYK